MFGLKKKKKVSALDLPPPPAPPGLERPKGDLPPIKPAAKLEPIDSPAELPELPELPPFEPQEPAQPELEAPSSDIEFPAPPMPEAPTPMEVEPMSPVQRSLPELQPIEEQVMEEREPRVRKTPGKAFVSVDEYRRILEHSNRVQAKLTEAEEVMKRLDDIRDEEEKAFDRWRAQLEDVERKLAHVDRVMEKAKR